MGFCFLKKGDQIRLQNPEVLLLLSLSFFSPFFFFWSKNNSLPELTAVSFVLQPWLFFFSSVWTLWTVAHKHRLLIYAKPGIHFDKPGVPYDGEGHCGGGAPRERLMPFIDSLLHFFQFIFFPKTQFPPHVSHVASDQHMQPPFMQTQSAGAFMLRGGSTFTDKESGISFPSWLLGRKDTKFMPQNRRRLHLRGT